MCANKSRACFIYCARRATCGTQKFVHFLPGNPYFAPSGRQFADSGRSGFGARFLFSRWVECSMELEPESRVVGQNWMPSRNCLCSKPPWLMQPLIPPPLFFFSSLLPSCCRPSQTGSRPRSLPRHNWISSPLFLLCLPPPGYPSTPHRHRDDKCIPPRASETSAVRQITSTWQTRRRPSVRPRAGITLNEFNSIKKRTKEECKITEEPLSSWWWWWLLFFPESLVLFCVFFF